MTDVDKLLQLHRDWLGPSEAMAAQMHDYLKDDLASDSLLGLDNSVDSLGILATYYGIRGVVAVSDGNQGGWTDVSNAILYRYWALRLLAKSFSMTQFLRGIQQIPNLTNHMGNAGCLLAGFIAAGRDDLAAATADILLGMVSVDGAVDAGYLKQRRFEPFMLWLYTQHSGNGEYAQAAAGSMGIFQSLVDDWDNPDDFATALSGACTYHVLNNDDVGGKWDPEFKNAPFDFLPLEIRAIEAVRGKQGLPTPAFDHPLLSLPTAAVENLEIVEDDLALEVETAYLNFYGG